MKHKILTFFLACLVPWLAGAQQSANSQNNVAEKDYIAYLFTYFTGNHISEEAVCYAVSTDGYTYWALNDNKPVIDSKIISSTGGVRDPHILRCEDGKTFYMVVTDMVSDNGWDSNRAMVLLKSTDLVNWNHSVINYAETLCRPGKTETGMGSSDYLRCGSRKILGLLVNEIW